MIDTPTLPRGMQGGAKCFSPILSHTLTQWCYGQHLAIAPRTVNNKGYKAHKETGCVA